MSTTIDQRVVEMRFDNKNFEQNVSTTMSTLDKLKQGLNLKGATQGLENVDAAAKRVNLEGLGSSVDKVGLRFNALYSIADQALRNITNSAMRSAKQIASSFTIDPIKTGFSEYETQINAVQTILANTESKGTTLQNVNRALDELNTYADKTIYNFTEMTRNIGTFTAAGVDLDTSVTAIQGIANLAAVSGSNAQQASTAMYQLSQALSSGTVRLMDWNSVVNAGMGGQVFQDALKATARNHGVAIDDMIKKQGSFRETLQEGWLTADILTETLSHFTMAAQEGTAEWDAYKKSLMESGYTEKQAEEIIKLSNTATDAATKVKTFTQLMDTLKEAAQSGWTQSWEIIVGDFEEAKGLLTEVSDRLGGIIGDAAEARNAVLSEGLSSGWKQLLGAGIADEEGYKEIFADVAKEHGTSIDEMVAKEKELDSSLSDSEAYQKVLKKGFADGSLSADMLSESVHKMADKMSKMSGEELKAAGYTQEHVKQIKELSEGLKNGEISMDDFVKKITRTSGRENIIQALWNAFDGLMSVITPVKEALVEIFPPLTGDQLYSFTQALVKFTEKLTVSGETAKNIKRTFAGIFATFKIGIQIAKALFGGLKSIIEYLAPAGKGLLGFTANLGDFLVGISEGNKVFNGFTKVLQKIGSFLRPVADGIKSLASSITDSFRAISDKAEVRLKPLTTLGNFIKSIFVGLGNTIKKIFPHISAIASAIGSMISKLILHLTSAIQSADFNELGDMMNGGIIATIGLIIAKFVKSANDVLKSGKSFMERIQDILDGIKGAINSFTESIKAKTLTRIAIAIGVLAVSLLVLSFIDSDKLTQALVSITALFGELMLSMKIFSKMDISDNIGKLSKALVKIATAIFILSLGLKIMSTMSWEEMGVGLISLTVGLGVLVGAVRLLPEKNVKKAAAAIKKLSTALVIFAVAMKIMGSMSWKEMGVGLISMAVGLGVLVGAVKILPKDTALRAAGMIGLATAMVILGAALKIMATMSWGDIARSLVALAGSLGVLAVTMKLMKSAIPGALAMLIITPALLGLAGALKIMATMSWGDIAKGLATLAGSLLIIAVAMKQMKSAILGATALIVISAALVVLSGALKVMGSMTWEEIAKSLVTLAGAFVVIGLASKILKPLVPTIMKLSVALVILGVACAAIGAGVLMIGIGLSSIAAAGAGVAVAIVTIVTSIVSLIPYIIEQIGVGIIKLCDVIAGGGSAIFGAIKTIILSIVEALVACVPAIVDGVFVLIDSLLTTLVEYTPTIVGKIFDFLISILETIAQRLPELIQAGVDLIMAFFSGVISALQSVDPTVLINGLLAVGVLTALMTALAALSLLAPAAMVGVVAMGVVIAELAFVLAAIGALAQIPGLSWLAGEGGALLQVIGTAIGQFVGGIVGGIAQGVSSSLPQIGSDLSEFMSNIQPFIDSAKSIDESVIDGVTSLATALLVLTGANLLDSITSWLTGGSSLADFGTQVAAFGPSIKAFADSVVGIDVSAVTAASTAVEALSNMAANLPNSGGVAGFFAGENDVGAFGEQLKPFGEGLKAYSDSVIGVDAAAVTNSAAAAKALAEMTSCIPNEGGVVAWFTGENSIAKFGQDLVSLGVGLMGFATATAGVNPESVTAAAGAAKVLAEMTSSIPNEGGVAAWFAGDNSISKFGEDLVSLGEGLMGFAEATAGVVPENIIAASGAAKALAEMTATIPNEGGVKAWFGGDNSISNFADQLPLLGAALLSFSTACTGIVPETITAAATAAKAITDMASTIPNEGGVKAWFGGDNSIAAFASQLPLLGAGLLAFSVSCTGIVPETITAAAMAAKAITDMVSTIPNEGGVVAWFAGDSSIASFASQLPLLGAGLLAFSLACTGIVPETVSTAAVAAKAITDLVSTIPNEGGVIAWFAGDASIATFASNLPLLGAGLLGFSLACTGIVPETITAAANAAKSITDMVATIPNEGGVKAWFSGDASIATFADQLPLLGAGLLGFSTAVAGVVPENITAAAGAAKALAEMTATIPNEGGIKAWFTGDSSISAFADKLPGLGEGLKGFADAVSGITPENITAAADAAKSLAQMTETVPGDTSKIITFGSNLETFGGKLKSYFTETSGISAANITSSTNVINAVKSATDGINSGKIKEASSAIDDLAKVIKDLSNIKEKAGDGFSAAIKKIADTNVESLISAFKNAGSDIKNAGTELMENFISGVESKNSDMTTVSKNSIDKFINGMKDKKSSVESAGKTIVTSCSTAISNKASSFKTAGKDLGNGLIKGIESKYRSVYLAAYELGKQAVQGEKDGQKSNSPSKLTIMAGKWLGEGLVIGMDKMSSKVYKAGYGLGESASSSISSTISRISDVINTDIDSQPTIRPVLDLSDVRSGASGINSLFNGGASVSLLANVNTISSTMNHRGQNGVNGDVVSAINSLRKDIGNMRGDTYQINGVTYDDGSNIQDAVGTLIRAANIARRV